MVLTACDGAPTASTTVDPVATTAPSSGEEGRVRIIVEVPFGTNSLAMEAAAEVLEDRFEAAVPDSAASAQAAGQRIQVMLVGPGVADVPDSVVAEVLGSDADPSLGPIPFELTLVSITRTLG